MADKSAYLAGKSVYLAQMGFRSSTDLLTSQPGVNRALDVAAAHHVQ